MARIGGRNTWIALPVGLMCLAVVGALAWLAIPMIPVAVGWVGESLRTATTQAQIVETPDPASIVSDDQALDCRGLYPDAVWAELVWTRDVLLSQSTDAPATSATSLTDALAPDVQRTCDWRSYEGTISTTLSLVGEDAVTVADASLRGQGFTCQSDEEQLTCTKSSGDVREENVLRDGVWLSTVESKWHPEEYGARLAAFVWD